jgi:hypothetical protein
VLRGWQLFNSSEEGLLPAAVLPELELLIYAGECMGVFDGGIAGEVVVMRSSSRAWSTHNHNSTRCRSSPRASVLLPTVGELPYQYNACAYTRVLLCISTVSRHFSSVHV